MKKLLCLLIILVTLCGLSCAGAASFELQPFTSYDLQGNQMTEEVFAQKKLTVLNVWATFCGPCIREMPELAQWAKELPEDVQLISLVVDVDTVNDKDSYYQSAVRIMNQAGAEFPAMILTDGLTQFTNLIWGVPTTFFIDSEGHFVHSEVVGADVDSYKRIVNEYLSR